MTAVVTPVVERKKGGMRAWMFLAPYWSHIDGRPFLTRFVFFFTPYGGCHITWIRQADNQREWPHDHSASFASLKLLGGYEEDVFSGDVSNPVKRHRTHRWLSCHVMKHDEAHSITRISRYGTVTLLFLARRRHGSNYWTPEGKKSIGLKMDEWS